MLGLGATFGRGACTNFPRDMANSDCVLIMGSNFAENHPVGFYWPLQAQRNGAKLIHVDPRFTRTSSACDMTVHIRAGSDLAFLGGLINHVLSNELDFREYVAHYTNASAIVAEDFAFDETTGLFSGWDDDTSFYGDTSSWSYEMETAADGSIGLPKTDPSLRHERCVYQHMKRLYARYTPEVVSSICGCAPEDVTRVAEALVEASGPDKTASIAYAMGWTQHAAGPDMIRAAAMLQLLLGNVGRPGGGVIALRGHSNVQGATDIPTLYSTLPNYLPMPHATSRQATLEAYIENGHTVGARDGGPDGIWKLDAIRGVWGLYPKLIISLLKAWYGAAASADNEFGYQFLPKLDSDESALHVLARMREGGLRGLFLFGQNPAVTAPNASAVLEGLRRLDWLVVAERIETESASAWYADPSGPPPADCQTEVFMLPVASCAEKSGSLTNTERLVQWHEKAVEPPGDCRSDLAWVHALGVRMKELYADSALPRDGAIKSLTWEYEPLENTAAREDPDPEAVLREINGYHTADGHHVSGIPDLAEDGSTACGSWLYAGVFPQIGTNLSRQQQPGVAGPGIYADWGWAWPANRRILYNRASADPSGRPWSERKKLVWWDTQAGRWTGYDVPDFAATTPPDYRPSAQATGMQAIAGDAPFIGKFDGRGWLFAPYGMPAGPLPVHYEPVESPFTNALYSTQSDPAADIITADWNPIAETGDARWPLVGTTYRLTEHMLGGGMTRTSSWLAEVMPSLFVEIGPRLAAERGIEQGDWVVVSSPRGEIEARAVVTERVATLVVNGRDCDTVGVPMHFGYKGEVVGSSANVLTAVVSSKGAETQASKSFVCDIRKGRLAARAVRSRRIDEPMLPNPLPGVVWSAQPLGRQDD